MSHIKVEVPSLGESITEATVGKWLVADRTVVELDQPICELETDKASVDLPSPSAGMVIHKKGEGDTVTIGDVVAEVDSTQTQNKTAPVTQDKAAKTTPAASSSAAESDALVRASVERLLKEHKLQAKDIPSSGPRGHLTRQDVLDYIEKQKAPPTTRAQKEVTPPQPKASVLPSAANKQTELVPMSRIRKKIAERLVKAQHEAAMLTTFNEVDMSAVMSLRSKYKEQFKEIHQVNLGFMSFFARAVALALQEYKVLNAYISGDNIVYNDAVHLGIAVSTERGLVVPVLKNVQEMGFAQIESEIRRMALSARDGKLDLNELSGGTFTITNGGVFGSMMSTPILNSPQSGILGMHAIKKRPIVLEDDSIVVRPMMYLALSYDHRLVDGRDSVQFLVKIKEYLEDPGRLLLQV